ncbi:MAG TPA: hypothetical protein ENK07_06020 [Bacteroidetes bacterium]|nr:hypothetical protein [Bacteroidota bacterium]
MPTYEYRCTECGHRFEVFQMISDPPVDQCPVCGGRVEKLISAGAGLLFKGSGFYITDYRSSSYKKAAESESKSSGTESSSSSSSSSTKSEKSSAKTESAA